MFDHFVEYIANAYEDEVRALSAEDMAICVAWYQSYAGDDERRERCRGLEDAMGLWVNEMQPPNHESEGSRQQPVLRRLVYILQSGRIGELERDELDFLCVIHDLMLRADRPEFFKRPLEALGPYMDALRQRRASLSVKPGLPTLAESIHVLTGEEISQARPREVRYLAGIELPCRGPVYNHRGILKVFDYVPENCTLVVEDGECYVSGFVLGKLVAGRHCEVRENVAGVAVVSRGDIRVRNIVNKAFVVSKTGQVRCRHSQDPNLVFAGEGIYVGESAILGHYVTPEMYVADEFVGGKVEISGTLHAGRFRQARAAGLSIVLRKTLSCEDYGEAIGREARRLMARSARLTRRFRNIERMANLAGQESEQHAESALMFICGGPKTKKLLDEIGQIQHRLAFLDRVLTGLQSVSFAAESNLSVINRSPEGLPGQNGNGSGGDIEDIERELDEIAAQGAIGEDLARRREEVVAMNRELGQNPSDGKVVSTVLRRLQEKEHLWTRERNELLEKLRQKEELLRRTAGGMEILESAGRQSGKLQILRQVLARIKEQPNDVLADRVQNPFVRFMLHSINSRLEHARNYKTAAREVYEQLSKVNRRLRVEYQIDMAGETEAPAQARVEGRFEAGVEIFVEGFDGESEDREGSGVLITPHREDEEIAYTRQGFDVVEEKPAQTG